MAAVVAAASGKAVALVHETTAAADNGTTRADSRIAAVRGNRPAVEPKLAPHSHAIVEIEATTADASQPHRSHARALRRPRHDPKRRRSHDPRPRQSRPSRARNVAFRTAPTALTAIVET